MLTQIKDEPIDFPRLLTEVCAGGFSFSTISACTGIPKTTLKSYRNDGVEPSHSKGNRLIHLWCVLHRSDTPPTRVTPQKRTPYRPDSSIQLSLFEG
jgi:hypothetical protein